MASLPAALQARLSKRGIIKNDDVKKADRNDEEIIAESYDDPNESEENNNAIKTTTVSSFDSSIDIEEIADCPNIANLYHQCTDYCKKKFGLKKFQPNPVLERRRIRMLKIYPLPANWKEVPDIETNRYYYWNQETDQVSWLSPTAPKAVITFSKNFTGVGVKRSIVEDVDDEDDEDEDEDGEEFDDEVEEVSEYTNEQTGTFEQDLDEFLSYSSDKNSKKKLDQGKDKRQKKERPLDPMDPSSYSDIPRGDWSQGLEKEKTGVDDSVSGPLFQSRPYPSPGQILKMNTENKKK